MAKGTSGSPQVKVDRFYPPAGADLFVFASVAGIYAGYAGVKAGLVEPGTFAWAILKDGPIPCNPDTIKWCVGTIFWLILASHAVELILFHRTRLAKHGVKLGTAVWWRWMSSCFFEGIKAIQRFDNVVLSLQEKAKK